jgi:hypothetical protein
MAGRKPKYNSALHDRWAWSLAIRGCKDQEIAEAMGISRKTLSEWKHTTMRGDDGSETKIISTFGEALASGKEAVDSKVEYGIFQRAIGMTVVEKEKYTVNGEPKVRIREKAIPPDVRAAEVWLYNRQSDRWKSPNSATINIKSDDEQGTNNIIVLPFGSDNRLNRDGDGDE